MVIQHQSVNNPDKVQTRSCIQGFGRPSGGSMFTSQCVYNSKPIRLPWAAY